ncbi:KR domain-containing protein, partial [Acidobacteriota bacterium]
GAESFSTVDDLDKESCREQWAGKVHGALALAAVFRERELDFCLAMSSLASILGGLGMAAYSAANLFLDAFAASQRQETRMHWFSVDWDMWQVDPGDRGKQLLAGVLGELCITPAEGVKAFHGVLSCSIMAPGGGNRVIISTGDMEARVRRWTDIKKKREDSASVRLSTRGGTPAPGLYEAPRNQVEQLIADIVKGYFGYEQVGSHDNFFDLGATSMDLVQLNSKLNAVWNKKIPLVKLLTYTTIRSLADYVTEELLSGRGCDQETDRSEALERGRRSIQQKLKIRRDETYNEKERDRK